MAAQAIDYVRWHGKLERARLLRRPRLPGRSITTR